MSETLSKDCRILVVDDEDIVQSLVRDALEDDGHTVAVAATGAEALDLINEHTFDLLITDIRMPGMTGIELVERARELHPNLGVVFMTGYANINSAKDAIKQGALDYIMKPFELNEIRQAVNNAIAKLNETAAQSSENQLSSLSDLNNMLFAADDRRSLVTSSLKFAMMHLHAERGSIVFMDSAREEYVMLTIHDDNPQEILLGLEPLERLTDTIIQRAPKEAVVVSSLEEHPLYRLQPAMELEKFLMPPWMQSGMSMITAPVMRAQRFMGIMMVELDQDTVKLKQTDLKFLAITAGQLAITLENVSLLEETQNAYARLKELQDETIQLEKMATRGEMSAEIGHELNNFLGVVAGNVGLLEVHLKKENYDQLDKYLRVVSETISKIKSFTANLMDLRPISSEKELVYFDKVVTEVVEYLRPQKKFEGVEIKMPDQLDTVSVMADSTQIQQLLYNLFHNAAEATLDCETKEIEVTLEKVGNDSFRFSIRDTGEGFAPESLSKAFQEKFTTKNTGHGFGLVVCKRIIDFHNGHLEIESSPGKGTCISITMPLANQSDQPTAAAEMTV